MYVPSTLKKEIAGKEEQNNRVVLALVYILCQGSVPILFLFVYNFEQGVVE
jgi:hypothetical protein